MVSVRMCFQQPANGKTFRLYVINDRSGRIARCAAGGGIVVKHAVDDRAGIRLRVAHDMAHRKGLRVEERLHNGASGCVLKCVLNERAGVFQGVVDNGADHVVLVLCGFLNISIFTLIMQVCISWIRNQVRPKKGEAAANRTSV